MCVHNVSPCLRTSKCPHPCLSVQQLEIQPLTQQTIYGLQIGKEYEVHIRCKMRAFVKFGEFSESIYIQVNEIPSTGKMGEG